MTARSLLSLVATTVLLVSLGGPACESACGDSAPGQGESCSGSATCGAACGERWECRDGSWSVSVGDCFTAPNGSADASTEATAPDAEADAGED